MAAPFMVSFIAAHFVKFVLLLRFLGGKSKFHRDERDAELRGQPLRDA